MSNRRWVLVFALLALLCLGVKRLQRPGGAVGVWQEGELICTLDPASVREPYTLTLSTRSGESRIHVGPDGVYMESAGCRSQLCVRHGPLRSGGTPIVCLPERIVIAFTQQREGVDAVSG